MKYRLINELKNKNFNLIKNIRKGEIIVLAIENDYYEDNEVYFDSLIGCEIERPHHFGKTINLTGNNNDVTANIYKHNDQQETLIKKVHFHKHEEDRKFKQKLRMLLNAYIKVL